MATFVHARRRTPGGQVFYRVWNTVVDQYETAPLTFEEALAYLTGELTLPSPARDKAEEAFEAVEQSLSGLEGLLKFTRDSRGSSDPHTFLEARERLARAFNFGTSSRLGDRDDLDSDWKKEMK